MPFVITLFSKFNVLLLAVWLVAAGVLQYDAVSKKSSKQTACASRRNLDKVTSGGCHSKYPKKDYDCEKNPCGRAPVKKASFELSLGILSNDNQVAAFIPSYKLRHTAVVKQFHEHLFANKIFQPPRLYFV